MRLRAALPALGSNLLIGSCFLPVWLASVALLVIAEIIAPETLSSSSLTSGVLPFMTFLAVASLGQMLVIMTGGIDLCVPGVIVLVANLMVGVGKGGNYYSPTGDYVGVWSILDNGAVPPRWTIGGPNGMLH